MVGEKSGNQAQAQGQGSFRTTCLKITSLFQPQKNVNKIFFMFLALPIS